MTHPENLNVLVVDDDEVDTLGIKRAFRGAKTVNSIVTAVDGREALEKLRSGKINKPCMVLLDLNMPRMNGFEFLDELRKDKRLKNTVIFVLTTSPDANDRARAYDRNVAGYIIKSGVENSFVDTAALFDQYARTVDLP